MRKIIFITLKLEPKQIFGIDISQNEINKTFNGSFISYVTTLNVEENTIISKLNYKPNLYTLIYIIPLLIISYLLLNNFELNLAIGTIILTIASYIASFEHFISKDICNIKNEIQLNTKFESKNLIKDINAKNRWILKDNIIEDMADLELSLQEYLNVWRKIGGGTTGFAIGSCIEKAKNLNNSFKKHC